MAQLTDDKLKMTDVGLKNNEMFLNFFVNVISREREVKFTMIGDQEHVGFITGFDEEWVQVTHSVGLSKAMLNIVCISSVEQTGRFLDNALSKEAQISVKKWKETVFTKSRIATRTKREIDEFS